MLPSHTIVILWELQLSFCGSRNCRFVGVAIVVLWESQLSFYGRLVKSLINSIISSCCMNPFSAVGKDSHSTVITKYLAKITTLFL